MTFEEFLINLKSAVDRELPDGTSLEYKTILKNNEVALTGAYFLREKGQESSQLFYMEPLFEIIGGDGAVSEAAKFLLREKDTPVPERISEVRVKCFDDVRERIIVRLIGKERNRNRLPDLVYRDFLDMAVSACIYFPGTGEEHGITEVSRKMAASWGVPDGELLDLALENTRRLFPDTLRTLREAAHLQDEDESIDGLYVLSNEACYLGASAVLYTEKLPEIAKKYASDLWMIPSSIHEFILLPGNRMDEDFLHAAVEDVNASSVPKEDILTGSLYLYRRESGRIERVPD